MGNKTVNTYDTHDNLIEVQKENSAGMVLSSSTATYNGYGELTLRTDANNHNTSFGYDTNGDLASVTTPLGNMTKFQYDALGTRTSKTDAIGNTVTYSLDNWERVTSANYPDGSAHTFGYDPDSNLVGFSDGTGTTTSAYDADFSMTSE
jgi:YD repeat-containing protein